MRMRYRSGIYARAPQSHDLPTQALSTYHALPDPTPCAARFLHIPITRSVRAVRNKGTWATEARMHLLRTLGGLRCLRVACLRVACLRVAVLGDQCAAPP